MGHVQVRKLLVYQMVMEYTDDSWHYEPLMPGTASKIFPPVEEIGLILKEQRPTEMRVKIQEPANQRKMLEVFIHVVLIEFAGTEKIDPYHCREQEYVNKNTPHAASQRAWPHGVLHIFITYLDVSEIAVPQKPIGFPCKILK